LDKAAEQLAYQDNALRVCNIRPGWIDTQRADAYQGNKISIDDIADVIEWVINAPPTLTVTSMTVLPR
jgi:NADP-dependent 3-hydroxy acid dehydrogenase YdfG